MKKCFDVSTGIGTAKYLVSFHDGIKTHNDGSRFFDIKIFRNKRKMENFIKELKTNGYTEGR